MRPDELERRLHERLDALGPTPRAELLHVLTERQQAKLETDVAFTVSSVFTTSAATAEFTYKGPVGLRELTGSSYDLILGASHEDFGATTDRNAPVVLDHEHVSARGPQPPPPFRDPPSFEGGVGAVAPDEGDRAEDVEVARPLAEERIREALVSSVARIRVAAVQR